MKLQLRYKKQKEVVDNKTIRLRKMRRDLQIDTDKFKVNFQVKQKNSKISNFFDHFYLQI